LLRHVSAVQYDVLLIICHAVNTADNMKFSLIFNYHIA